MKNTLENIRDYSKIISNQYGEEWHKKQQILIKNYQYYLHKKENDLFRFN